MRQAQSSKEISKRRPHCHGGTVSKACARDRVGIHYHHHTEAPEDEEDEED